MFLNKFIKEKRLEKALTQKEAGEQLGFAKSQFISSLETGASRPPIPVLKRMCEVYNVSEEEMRQAYLKDAIEEAQEKASRAWPRKKGLHS
ncbi:helix-turn-helix domain-containing protein [Bdellovibrio sp. HCB274]|uniref:helix-turn-helix domain-containing protein n=1 Tax=Bdellovibrio sp. HCB274 TaxID=3394361 RepID=UPI0039B68F62